MEDQTVRIERLERRCRWLSRSVVAMGLLLGIALVAGAQKPKPSNAEFDQVKVRRLFVVDEGGNERIFMSVRGDDATVLMTYPSGKMAYRATVTADHPQVLLVSPETKVLSVLPPSP